MGFWNQYSEEKLFLTDVDNCILDWSKGFQSFLSKKHPEVKVDITNYKLGIEPALMTELVEEFNTSYEFSELQPYGQSDIYLPKLVEDFGFQFVAISTCIGQSLGTAHLRKEGIERVFDKGIFKEYVCLPLAGSKLSTLKKYKPTYWIDDKLSHSIDGTKAGHISFNMVQPYNINEEKPNSIVTVKNWHEVYNFVKINILSRK